MYGQTFLRWVEFCSGNLDSTVIFLKSWLWPTLKSIEMYLKAFKSTRRIQSFFSFMDIHLEEINLQNAEKYKFNSSVFKCNKTATFEVGLTDLQAILSPRVGVLGVKRKVRVSSSLWRPAEVEEGSVGFSCLSAGTPPSTSSNSTLAYVFALRRPSCPAKKAGRGLKVMKKMKKVFKI